MQKWKGAKILYIHVYIYLIYRYIYLIIVDDIFSPPVQFTLLMNQMILIVLWCLGAVITNDIYFIELEFGVFFWNKWTLNILKREETIPLSECG